LIPEDYETYEPDGTGYGDYPKLPLISAESRDPHALYDFPELKRNFGEPMHVDADMVGEDRWDYNKRYHLPMWKMLAMFLTATVGGGLVFCLCEYIRVVPTPMMPRQLPGDGKRKYYSFELEDKRC
jgi:NADH dehydrogenase (ubiquinone) 1 beta subcomplex subunit 8